MQSGIRNLKSNTIYNRKKRRAFHKGTLSGFLAKLSVLEELTRQGVFSFDSQALSAYLETYQQAGYPAVSHSEIYRNAYRPAYRVVQL